MWLITRDICRLWMWYSEKLNQKSEFLTLVICLNRSTPISILFKACGQPLLCSRSNYLIMSALWPFPFTSWTSPWESVLGSFFPVFVGYLSLLTAQSPGPELSLSLDPHLFCCIPQRLDFWESSHTHRVWFLISELLPLKSVSLALASVVCITYDVVFDLLLS